MVNGETFPQSGHDDDDDDDEDGEEPDKDTLTKMTCHRSPQHHLDKDALTKLTAR